MCLAGALALKGPARSRIQGKARTGDVVNVQFISTGIAMLPDVGANTAALSLATAWLRAHVLPVAEA